MNERLLRVGAIVKADLLIRFRRPSTLVVFLLLSCFVYVWIPDPSTGWGALVVDDNRRALYNSAALGLATAMLATLFVGLAGFYVISNAIGRDVASRCGFVIASTPMRSSEYLVGKVIGNTVFLATFTIGFMISSMGMLLVRNEATLEPWVFLKHYLLLAPPQIVFVAVLAVVFESIPFLSGRLGDVLYFFLWLVCPGVVLAMLLSGLEPGPLRILDFAGLAFVFEQMRPAMQTSNISLGGPFDPAKALFVVQGLTLDRVWMLPRIVSLLTPLPLLALALHKFHRFDPARVRRGGKEARKGWTARINAACRPLTRVLFAFSVFGRSTSSRPSLARAAGADARLTLAAQPVVLIAALGLAIAALGNSAADVARAVLPAAFALAGVFIADVPCRERRAGTLGLIYAAPLLKMRFVWWKLLTTTIVAAALLVIPLARVAFASPASIAALAVGLFFVVSVSTSLGVMSATPKTFIVLFLTGFYIVINDAGRSPALDFAGFYGSATPRVTLSYAIVAAAFLAAAQVVHIARLRREK